MANQLRKPERPPSPVALLEAARREEGRLGKLRIFVGAAPGVGKTYEMPQSAHARARDGCDVVVGIVETHGRKETAALLEGMEIIPCQRLEYKGQLLEEMDLEAIIARRPQIVPVDELARTNAAGSRHPKRYLDVELLLSHGIDVYSMVNIQHIESLNDVVARITDVRVRATVPAGTTVRIQSWPDRDSIGLQVLDQGAGTLPGDLNQIFDKFYQAHKVDQVRAGAGLGLAISRGFIEAMPATISAADRTGTVFTIRLPVPTQVKQPDTAA